MLWEELFANHGKAKNKKQKRKKEKTLLRWWGFLIPPSNKLFGWTIFKKALGIKSVSWKTLPSYVKEKNNDLLFSDQHSANCLNVARICFKKCFWKGQQ